MLQSTVANYLSPEDDPVNLLAARMNPNIAAQGAKARANMAPPNSIMDPRYPAWKKSQDDAELLMLISDMALSAIPLAGPAARGAMATGRALAPTAGKVTENYLVRSGGILPMDTWHGSPHRFPPTAKNPLGEFDPMKIGTGEGAQAYGHGFYLAENPGVAKGYQDALQTTDTLLNGKKVFPIDPNFSAASSISANGYDTALAMARRGATEQFLTPEGRAHSAVLAKQIEALKGANIKNAPSGNLYKVDLPDEHIAKMLDWDKPLSQQAGMAKAFEKAFKDYAEIYANTPQTKTAFYDAVNSLKSGDMTGEGAYKSLARIIGGKENADTVSNVLKREYGIPGIRYLDQGSRAGGSGTSNFVVFDPAHMNIIGRE